MRLTVSGAVSVGKPQSAHILHKPPLPPSLEHAAHLQGPLLMLPLLDVKAVHPCCVQPDGRAQPSREDKVEFLLALSQAAAGHLPLQMLYFLKYLDKHGEEDGNPLIDRDLFFYCEVQKFKVSGSIV